MFNLSRGDRSDELPKYIRFFGEGAGTSSSLLTLTTSDLADILSVPVAWNGNYTLRQDYMFK
jgi:hypothetical protein